MAPGRSIDRPAASTARARDALQGRTQCPRQAHERDVGREFGVLKLAPDRAFGHAGKRAEQPVEFFRAERTDMRSQRWAACGRKRTNWMASPGPLFAVDQKRPAQLLHRPRRDGEPERA